MKGEHNTYIYTLTHPNLVPTFSLLIAIFRQFVSNGNLFVKNELKGLLKYIGYKWGSSRPPPLPQTVTDSVFIFNPARIAPKDLSL
jgi:hypothetical protein